ncbi:hypothetical protein [Falsiruegeria mediterranea]|jgi:hypothetical protein|uniref:Protein translocase subunit SecE n=1 Tax=Falsiruegeria mediterranea M17 TaxID=1200281 RepID=A0A2R8CBJ5_9RHOB|nr:hypothetical protein [Falsiruegeria mediterranea]SPJ29804.1 hypothetical protein TRM7615_03326 [Falsiruegeria mediterranea M17]
MNIRHFLRMSRIARNPPSEKQVLRFLAVLGVCLLLFGIEFFGFWPEWATVNSLKP